MTAAFQESLFAPDEHAVPAVTEWFSADVAGSAVVRQVRTRAGASIETRLTSFNWGVDDNAA